MVTRANYKCMLLLAPWFEMFSLLSLRCTQNCRPDYSSNQNTMIRDGDKKKNYNNNPNTYSLTSNYLEKLKVSGLFNFHMVTVWHIYERERERELKYKSEHDKVWLFTQVKTDKVALKDFRTVKHLDKGLCPLQHDKLFNNMIKAWPSLCEEARKVLAIFSPMFIKLTSYATISGYSQSGEKKKKKKKTFPSCFGEYIYSFLKLGCQNMLFKTLLAKTFPIFLSFLAVFYSITHTMCNILSISPATTPHFCQRFKNSSEVPIMNSGFPPIHIYIEMILMSLVILALICWFDLLYFPYSWEKIQGLQAPPNPV